MARRRPGWGRGTDGALTRRADSPDGGRLGERYDSDSDAKRDARLAWRNIPESKMTRMGKGPGSWCRDSERSATRAAMGIQQRYDSDGRQYDSDGRRYDSDGRRYDSDGRGYDSDGRGYDSDGRGLGRGPHRHVDHGRRPAVLRCGRGPGPAPGGGHSGRLGRPRRSESRPACLGPVAVLD